MGVLKKCYQIDNNFKKFIHHITFLNTYYIETRYPQEHGLIVEEEDALMCLQYAKEIFTYKF